MTVFTQEYLSLISYYSRVLSTRKDLHLPLVGYYSQVPTKLHDSKGVALQYILYSDLRPRSRLLLLLLLLMNYRIEG